jgi:V/A-type H+-transporting ATPase subunit K
VADPRPAEAPATPATQSQAGLSDSIRLGMYAAGLTIIMVCGAVTTALVQKVIGAAVVGAVAEDRKFFGMGLILLALPETILFICAGFAYLLFGKLS